MKIFFSLIFFPIRFFFWVIRGLGLFLSKGNHVYIKIPASISDSTKSFFLRKIQGEEEPPFLVEFLQNLELISKDPRVKKISLEIPKLNMGYSEVMSIYKELESCKSSGIEIRGFAEEGDIKTLFLLSLCDLKLSSETGEFSSVLPSVETMFFGEVAKKWNIKIDVFQSGPYKSFGEIFTRKDFSKEARSNLQTLIEDNKKEIFSILCKKPGLSEDILQRPIIHSGKLKDTGFLSGLLDINQYRNHYLHNDPVAYSKEWTAIENLKDNEKEREIFKKSNPPNSKPLTEINVHSRYKFKIFKILGDRRKILAILPLKGQIVSGKPEETEPKSGVIEGYSIVNAIQELKNNSKISAVLLEIDSPGGSATESERIFQAIKDLDKTKPVFAYMSNTCASGGYYIACAARKIFSSPISIVGSIGTIMLRFNLEGFYSKWGITKDRIGFYPMREIYSESGKLSRDSIHFLKTEIMRVENLFLRRVEESRKVPGTVLENMAGGRVFSAGRFNEANLIDGVKSLGDCIRDLEKETNEKSLSLHYIAPRYNIKMALRSNMSFMKVILPEEKNTFSFISKLVDFKNSLDHPIQNIWLGGIKWQD